MSSAGQIIGAAIGVAAVIFLPGFGQLYGLQLLGATLGAATLGASIGGLIDPPRVSKPNFGSLGASIGSPRYGFEKLQSTASPDLPVPVLYGALRLAGNIIYQSDERETSSVPDPGAPPTIDHGGGFFSGFLVSAATYFAWEQSVAAFNASGGTRTEIDRCIGICEGEIEGVYDVKINDEPITDFPNCSYDFYSGTSTQTVDSRFTGVVDGLRYTSYLAMTLSTSDKLRGSANVTFTAVGKKIKTWNGSEWSSAKTWSDNPAACIRDILLSKQYGVGLPETALDSASFGSVYEWCNGVVTGFNGAQERRATLNYIVDSRKNILDVLNDMLATFGGFLVLNANKIKLRVERAEAASQAFNMSNIVRGSFSYVYLNRNERANRVKVQYIDPDYNYTKVFAIADDPNDQDDRRAMGVGEDVIEKEFSLLGVTNPSQASRIAELVLNLGKVSNIMCTFEAGMRAIGAEVGDVCTISHDVTGWVDKPFRILTIQEKKDDIMTIVCREYNASIYSDNPGQNIIFQNFGDVPSSINAPNPPRNFAVFQNGGDLIFTWDAPIPKFEVVIDHYEIREGSSWGAGQLIANDVPGTTITFTSFTTGQKTYFIKAISSAGVESASATDNIDIGIPAGFNAIITYHDIFDTQFRLGGMISSGAEIIRTTDYDSTQWLRVYALKTQTLWDVGNWDDSTKFWDTPVTTTNQTIIIGDNNEIDMLADTTASIGLEIAYYVGNDSQYDNYTRTVEVASKASSDSDWGDWAVFTTGFAVTQKRYVKFRATIGTTDSADDIRLVDFNVRIDVPDKIDRDNNVSVPSSGLAIEYNIDFLSKVAVTVTTVGGSSLTPVTSNKSLTGFTVTLYDISGNPQAGTVDWVASGY